MGHILSGTTLVNLYRLLRDNRFHIDVKQYPVVLLILVLIVLNTPFILLEKWIYKKRIQSTKVIQPVFILGYPRSGTTHLIYQLSMDPQFAWCRTFEALSPHVMILLGPFLREISEVALPKKRPMDNMPMGSDLPMEEEFAIANMGMESMAHALYFPKQFTSYTKRFTRFKDKFEKVSWQKNHYFLLQKLTYQNPGKQLILKSPFDTARIPELLELYPDAKFIHIVRNPYSVYSSNKRLYQKILPQLALQQISDHAMERHIKDTYEIVYHRFLEASALLTKSQLYQIKYEAFIGHEHEVIKDIYNHFGILGAEDAAIRIRSENNATKSYNTNAYTLTREEEEEISRQWAFSFKAFGYSPHA